MRKIDKKLLRGCSSLAISLSSPIVSNLRPVDKSNMIIGTRDRRAVATPPNLKFLRILTCSAVV